MKDGTEEGIWLGIIGTFLSMAVIWLVMATIIEDSKTENGYLTNNGKIYSVEYVADKKEMKDYIKEIKESK